MAGADPLTLAVREHAAWCDLVCRLHRFTPEGDARLWWSARRTPDLFPDAVTLVPDLSVLDVLGRINDSPGASVKDSFATLDLTDQGWTVLFDATWVARPPRTGVDDEVASTFAIVHERFPFAAWCRAWGGPADVLPTGLRRVPGVTVLGREGDTGVRRRCDRALHRDRRHCASPACGTPSARGPTSPTRSSHRHPEAWIVGYERGAGLDAALAAGFTAVGPLRVWHRGIRSPSRPQLWALRDSNPRPSPCQHMSPERCATSRRSAMGQRSA